MTVAAIARRIDGLDLWDKVAPYHWALKPHGTAFPYFCVILKGQGTPVKARIMLLEGWKTFQDFLRMRIDPNFGFYSSPEEFPQYELVLLNDGSEPKLYRQEPCYMPVQASAAGEELCRRMLWEILGVMMRIEIDDQLPMKFATDKALFARVEGPDGTWRDEPLAIPMPQPHVEHISIPAAVINIVKDMQFAQDEVLELDFRIMHGIYTHEEHPRCVYVLLAIDAKTGARVILDSSATKPDHGLRSIWETMPPRIVKRMMQMGHVPGEIRLLSQRMFRLLRPLCVHLPFKVSLHDKLPNLEASFAELVKMAK